MLANANQLQRYTRLQQDLEDMKSLDNLAPSFIRFIAHGKDPEAPDQYTVQIEVTSITDLTRYGTPITQDNFQLEIHLPPNYPTNARPKCKVRPAPYHPHFKTVSTVGLGKRYGLWIDPYEHDESLASFVLKIMHSLQYNPTSIKINSRIVANRDALEWYSHWMNFFNRGSEKWFPTDKKRLPDILPESQKKFYIQQPKKFDMNHGVKREGENSKLLPVSPERKTFSIVETTPPYQPVPGSLPELSNLQPSSFNGSCKTHRLYIKPKAVEQIFHHISWDKSTSQNRVEQGGILLGHTLRDEEKDVLYGVVEEAIAGASATGTSTYLEMTHATWKEMIDQVDTILESSTNINLQIIGWYHTHPNQLDVFMSSTDATTQKLIFSNDWQFAVVLNPHRKIWAVFHGKDCEECQGFMITK